MTMKVKAVADLVGISIRTLHHYDEIGLLVPSHISSSGYRLYSNHDLEMLQQILFFKEMGFSLKKIKEVITNPSFDHQDALLLHRRVLLEKQERIQKMLSTLDKTLQHMKGDIEMSNKEKFEGFNFNNNPYEQEARERWGNEAVDTSVRKFARKSQVEQEKLSQAMDTIYRNLADLRKNSPESNEAQAAIGEWYDYLNNNFGDYPLDVFKGLGQMYVDDPRFTKNIDKYGEGLAQFMRDTMAIYADRQQK